MSKLTTRFIKYSDKSFKNKFYSLISDDKKISNKISFTVTEIIKKIKKNGDDNLKHYVRKFDKINVNKINELFISKKTIRL